MTVTDTKRFVLGFDIGSSAIHSAILNQDLEIIHCGKPLMHFADIAGAMAEVWEENLRHIKKENIIGTTFTGEGAQIFSSVLKDFHFVHESVAIPRGGALLEPDVRYIFYIGAKNTYFFEISSLGKQAIVNEWKTGSKCGGGAGTLIEKQCRRLFQDSVIRQNVNDWRYLDEGAAREERCIHRHAEQKRLEKMFDLAERQAGSSENPSHFLARCGVVIQSDLIHKQNQGALQADNLAGLFQTIAHNYMIDVLGGRDHTFFKKAALALGTGGVLKNRIVNTQLAQLVGLPVLQPNRASAIAAIGAAA